MKKKHSYTYRTTESVYANIIDSMSAYNPNILEEQKKYLKNVLEFLHEKSAELFEMRAVIVIVLLDIEPDMPTVLACLLHELEEEIVEDVILSELLCDDALNLMKELKKISTIHYQSPENSAIIKRYLLSKIEDIRVLYIRVAKRIGMLKLMRDDENLYTEKKRQRALSSVWFIIIPLLSHLGLYKLKTIAEDLYFELTNKKEYDFIKNSTRENNKKTDLNSQFNEKIQHIKHDISNILKKENIIDIEIFARKKGIYSIYKKIKEKDYHSVTDVHDIFALRIITYSVEECYKVLSVLHTEYDHEEEHFSDYIATPKLNGYESIHTIVSHENNFVEVQIRTQEMDYNAEVGSASHWAYKGIQNISTNKKNSKLENTENIENTEKTKQSDIYENKQFNALKNSLPQKIYALTPTGEIKELSIGATPIDFAYSIHSDIGDHCSGAIVNGKIVSLTYKIQEGDMIGILTDKNKFPKKEWLDFVASESARQKIKSYLFSIGENVLARIDKTQNKKQDTNVEKALNKDLKNNIKNVVTKKTKAYSGLIIGGQKNMIHHFAKCCNSEKKRNIVAYASNTRDFVIHHKNCGNLKKLDDERILRVEESKESIKLKEL